MNRLLKEQNPLGKIARKHFKKGKISEPWQIRRLLLTVVSLGACFPIPLIEDRKVR